MKNVIFIAPPAAGKGTISEFLIDKYNYNHISTGDLLRSIASENNDLGRVVKELIDNGKFVSDDIIFQVLENALSKLDNKPFLLDGVPRKLNQAEYLTKIFDKLNVNNYVVINININDKLLEERVLGRRICNNCNLSYNIYFEEFKPINEDKCNKCNGNLIIRNDDNLETFRNRLETFKNLTIPLINYYQEKNLLKNIDGSKNQNEILEDIVKIIEGNND